MVKCSHIEKVWINKVNSPLSELVIVHGESKFNALWAIPLMMLFYIANFIVHGLIITEKYIRKIK